MITFRDAISNEIKYKPGNGIFILKPFFVQLSNFVSVANEMVALFLIPKFNLHCFWISLINSVYEPLVKFSVVEYLFSSSLNEFVGILVLGRYYFSGLTFGKIPRHHFF